MCEDISAYLKNAEQQFEEYLEKLYLASSTTDEIRIEVIQTYQLALFARLAKIASDPISSTDSDQMELKNFATIHIENLAKFMGGSSPIVKEKSFLGLCDMLIAFNYSFKQQKTRLHLLGFEPSKELITLITNYFHKEMTAMMTEITEDDDENLKSIRKTDFLAAYGRLVAFHAMPGSMKDQAYDVLQYFVEKEKSTSALIKTFLAQIRAEGPAQYADALVTALQKKWEIEEEEAVPENRQYEKNVLGLAIRFANIFGPPTATRKQEVRVALAKLIYKGFRFATTQGQLQRFTSFLKWGLAPFVPKLDQAAAAHIFKHCEDQMKDFDKEEKDVAHLAKFISELKEVAEKVPGTKKAPKAPAGKKGRKRKSVDTEGVEKTAEGEETAAEGEKEPAKKKAKTTEKRGTKRKSTEGAEEESPAKRSRVEDPEEEAEEVPEVDMEEDVPAVPAADEEEDIETEEPDTSSRKKRKAETESDAESPAKKAKKDNKKKKGKGSK